MENEHQRPEGALIERAVKASGRSIRKIAASIEISDTRLRHIINGYQPVGRGQKIEIVGPADTLARVAKELSIDPEAMRDAGRADAAEAMLHGRERDPGVDIGVEVAARELLDFIEQGHLEGEPPSPALALYTDEQIAEDLLRRVRKNRAVIDSLERVLQTRVDERKEGDPGANSAAATSEPSPEGGSGQQRASSTPRSTAVEHTPDRVEQDAPPRDGR